MLNRHLAALHDVGQLEIYLHEIADLETRMGQMPLWTPAHALGKQAAEARRMINDMQRRMDRHLVVTLIGPSGAGKSTLLNALAGVDDLSAVGHQRPTTQELIVLANDNEAAHKLLAPLGQQQVKVRSSPAAEALSHMILVDTPDTDSTEREAHKELLFGIIEQSDVLLCVFDAQNPKRRDHIDFMAPLVRRFHGASLVAVVNKCDRQSAGELSEVIAPEFDQYLHQAWDTAPEAILLISARRHLQNPRWDSQAAPRHDLDQYEQLQTLIFDTFNRPGFGSDRRLANARQIRDFVLAQTRQAAAQDSQTLVRATEKITTAEQEARQQALEGLRADDRRQIFGVQVRLYQSLAQRWLGPVGWLVAIWSRLIIFGSGLAALVRFGNPVRQLWGMVSAWRKFKESRSALAALNDQDRVDSAMRAFRTTMLTDWPDIGELLVSGRFDAKVRQLNATSDAQVGQTLDQMWADALDTEIERRAKGLSHLLLQALFNLPSLALMAYVGWLTALRFISGNYLSSDFFLHALLTIAVVLLLSFFILQGCVRLAVSRDRIQRRAFESVQQAAAQSPLIACRQVADQVARVIKLADKQDK